MSGGATAGARVVLGGTATVHCVHDRQKRQIITEQQVAELGLRVGQLYDPAQHKMHLCACCQNLFVDPTDIPRFCSVCTRPAVHSLGGPLPPPRGVVDG